MTYPGGKGQCFTHIINQMPPHQVYIETHLGGGFVMANKKPARLNIGLDLDGDVIRRARDLHARNGVDRSGHTGNGVASSLHAESGVSGQSLFLVIDAVEFLSAYPFNGSEFVYADPPYVRSTRRSPKRMYRFEYSDADHVRLLDVLALLPCHVAISGYPSDLYAERLVSWRTIQYQVQVRSGATATEWLWMNYSAPESLHDYSYLGERWRERQRIHRQQRRWVARLAALPPLEQKAMLQAIDERFRYLHGSSGVCGRHGLSPAITPETGRSDVGVMPLARHAVNGLG